MAGRPCRRDRGCGPRSINPSNANDGDVGTAKFPPNHEGEHAKETGEHRHHGNGDPEVECLLELHLREVPDHLNEIPECSRSLQEYTDHGAEQEQREEGNAEHGSSPLGELHEERNVQHGSLKPA